MPPRPQAAISSGTCSNLRSWLGGHDECVEPRVPYLKGGVAALDRALADGCGPVVGVGTLRARLFWAGHARHVVVGALFLSWLLPSCLAVFLGNLGWSCGCFFTGVSVPLIVIPCRLGWPRRVGARVSMCLMLARCLRSPTDPALRQTGVSACTPPLLRKKASKASEVPGGSSAGAAAATAEEPQEDSSSSSSSSAYVRSLEEKLEHHRKIIRVYQSLSSLAMSLQEKKQGAIRGRISGGAKDGRRRRVVKHRLILREGIALHLDPRAQTEIICVRVCVCGCVPGLLGDPARPPERKLFTIMRAPLHDGGTLGRNNPCDVLHTVPVSSLYHLFHNLSFSCSRLACCLAMGRCRRAGRRRRSRGGRAFAAGRRDVHRGQPRPPARREVRPQDPRG